MIARAILSGTLLLSVLLTATCSRVQSSPATPSAGGPPQPGAASPASPQRAGPAAGAPGAAQPVPGEQLCIAGHVAGGGGQTPDGLVDAPRRFNFMVERDDGGTIEVGYRALPPGPIPRPRPALEFHRGEVVAGDYMLACGRVDTAGALRVSETDHSMRTVPTARVLVVRHAERASQTDQNSNLDPDTGNAGIGVTRAAALSGLTATAGVSAIYTTEFCRTAQTAQPSAQALGLGLKVLADQFLASTLTGCIPAIVVPQESLSIAFDAAPTLASAIVADHPDEVVLVVGHSNTVPSIVEALAGESPCPRFLDPVNGVCQIPEGRFGDLFEISIPPAPGVARVTHASY